MAFLVPALKSAKIPLEEELLTRVRSSFTLSRPCFRLTYDKIVSRIAIISQVNSTRTYKSYSVISWPAVQVSASTISLKFNLKNQKEEF